MRLASKQLIVAWLFSYLLGIFLTKEKHFNYCCFKKRTNKCTHMGGDLKSQVILWWGEGSISLISTKCGTVFLNT